MSQFCPDTRLEELDLRASVIGRLQAAGIVRLADFAEATENELLAVRGLGRLTFERLRAALSSIGLEFQSPPDPTIRAIHRNRRLYELGRRTTPYLDTPLEELGIEPTTFERLWNAGKRRLRDLQAMTARDLYQVLGKMQGRAVIALLARANQTLSGPPSQGELWRYGFLTTKELRIRVTPETPLADLMPFIGLEPMKRLAAHGVSSFGDLVRVLPELEVGSKRVTHIGEARVRRLREFVQSNGSPSHSQVPLASLDAALRPQRRRN
jgi:hypothetical protein